MSDDIERRSIDSIARVYHSSKLGGINEAYHLAVRDAMIPISGGESALELGCGTGLWTRALCDRYDVVDVVDASLELLDHVRLLCQDCRAKLSCHPHLVEEFSPGPEQRWTHIYLTFLLEHLRDPIKVLETIKAWLTPRGSLFLAVPNANSIHRELAVRMRLLETIDALSDNDRRVGHRRVYTATLLGEQLTASGYEIVREHQIGLKPLSLTQMADYPEPLATALCNSGDLAGQHAAYLGVEAICRSVQQPGHGGPLRIGAY